METSHDTTVMEDWSWGMSFNLQQYDGGRNRLSRHIYGINRTKQRSKPVSTTTHNTAEDHQKKTPNGVI